MKRIFAFFLFVCSVFVVYGANYCDSIKVFFDLNKATFNPVLDNNASSMKNFIDSLIVEVNSGNLDHIVVYGYASPDGPFANNDKLAEQRCNTIADYISRHAGIPMADIRTAPGGVAWESLRVLVSERTFIPAHDKVLRVLDEYIPDACTDRVKSDQCVRSLIAIDEGHTYTWMLKNLFPLLRYSLAVYTGNRAENSSADLTGVNADAENIAPENAVETPEEVQQVETEVSADTVACMNSSIGSTRWFDDLVVKTNLLDYGVLMPNIEVEWKHFNRWSVAFEAQGAWWSRQNPRKTYRIATWIPEVRYWPLLKSKWHGLYVGVFAGGGIYDIDNSKKGHEGEAYMGGVSVGYMWPISKHFSLEAGLGVGYMRLHDKSYVPLDGHYLYQMTKNINYFGPLRAKLSLVWRFRVKKPNGRNEESL